MKCCILGAGAVGSHLAVKLALGGHDVSVLARGAQLAAIREAGLVLQQGEQQLHAEVRASDDASTLGVQDLVFITTKATALAEIAKHLPPLVGADTRAAFLQNGMTWWYPLELPADRPRPPQLPIFGLADALLRIVRPEQVVGGVIYSANEMLRPGVVRNNSPARNMVELGTPDDRADAALQRAREALAASGIQSPDVPSIRTALWMKLVINCVASSLSVATLNPKSITDDPAIQSVYVRMLQECMAVAAAHGYPVADRIDIAHWTQHRAQHKPSMLQDFEAARPMEVAEIVLAPRLFARAAALDTPTIDALTSVVARLAADRGLFAEL
jgi:2-dehydropantoate 2-reductase